MGLALLRKGLKIKKANIFLGLFFLVALISLIATQNIKISFYHLIKLSEFLLLFLYIKQNIKTFKITKLFSVFIASGVFQAIIAILQFFNQASLGLKHFEVGILNANIPGVATFFVNNHKLIRAYGTAPHPNVLAAFLLIVIFFLYYLYLSSKSTKIHRAMLTTCLAILMLGLFLTFSRAIIIVFAGVSLVFLIIAFFRINKASRFKVIALFLLVILFSGLIIGLLWPEISTRFSSISTTEQAITLRVYYNKIAWSAIKQNPLTGLGIGNFTWYLVNNYQLKEFWLYQPVHNLYLLVASELGIIALVLFLVFIGKILFKQTKKLFTKKISLLELCVMGALTSLLFLGLVDHYLWTIQQTSLLFWFILAMASGLIFLNHDSKIKT